MAKGEVMLAVWRLALMFVVVLSAGVRAHPLAPESACVEPERPPRTDIERWNRFVDDVDVFRQCIAEFAETEHEAAEAHRRASEQATERWNRFVRDHLNVPKDFPHRSEGTSGARASP